MKRILNIAAITAIMVLTASLRNTATAQDDDYYEDDYYDNGNRGEVSYQTFYDELSPHGRWVDYPEYGYVWVPNAGRNFRPYSTNGHWVWTSDYEWMWVSDYSWGWAPFHYGRWFYDPFYGWVWVPGYEWSPAWVAWRGGGDYYGWAPIRPGITISIHFGFGSYSPPYDYWCFAPRRYITSPRIHNYYYDRSQNVTIINQTTIINNYNYGGNVWRTGPSRFEAERYAGRITPVRFRESSRPGRTQFRNNEVSVYRPRVREDNTRRFSPRNVERYDRQASNNRATRNETRPQGNDRRFERNNDTRRNSEVTTRGNRNNLPRRERTMESPVERRNNEIRQPRERRQFDRPITEQPGRDPRREMRTMERPQQRERPQQMERPQQRERMQQMERPQQRERPQQIERPQQRERPQQMERPQQRERPQQMDRPQQMERRQAQSSPGQAQPQQRQIERRSDDGGNRSGGNGNGKGRGRF